MTEKFSQWLSRNSKPKQSVLNPKNVWVLFLVFTIPGLNLCLWVAMFFTYLEDRR